MRYSKTVRSVDVHGIDICSAFEIRRPSRLPASYMSTGGENPCRAQST